LCLTTKKLSDLAAKLRSAGERRQKAFEFQHKIDLILRELMDAPEALNVLCRKQDRTISAAIKEYTKALRKYTDG
jgi:hypothetical protein